MHITNLLDAASKVRQSLQYLAGAHRSSHALASTEEGAAESARLRSRTSSSAGTRAARGRPFSNSPTFETQPQLSPEAQDKRAAFGRRFRELARPPASGEPDPLI